ncbi:helix-turn-helix domain-containing protein [Actinomadura montaniterrae]|uniref:Helix-turn-helix domain-containing protein n=1 Tax=Actinomadura montaniterrae TaxID=1803903 RepID=A0A6L3VZA6_9ACTN|nr:helix-turn-helix transcriptional regulator [Actinomadura montaniterrae]KAB2384772.1 helix-turn-helix domain-containing protein [Actinomadura montaniterrae]
MSSPSSSAQRARQALAGRLREIRLAASVTGRGLAAEAGWHFTKVSKLETATTAPSADDIRAWCRICRADHLVEELLADRLAADSAWMDWRRMERAGLRQAQEAVRDIYETTRLYRSYSPDVIPGLLQTRAYVTAILEAVRARRGITVDDIDAAVAERMARQHILHEGDHRFAFVLEEAALRYRLGDPAVVAGQLGHLLTVMSLPSVALSIIPLDAPRPMTLWPVEGFYVFDEVQVNVELVSGFLTITQPREVADYLEVFADLSAVAVSGAAARALITRAIGSLE